MRLSTLKQIIEEPVLKRFPGAEAEALQLVDEIAHAVMKEIDWLEWINEEKF